MRNANVRKHNLIEVHLMTEVDDFAGSAFSADPKADTLPQKG